VVTPNETLIKIPNQLDKISPAKTWQVREEYQKVTQWCYW